MRGKVGIGILVMMAGSKELYAQKQTQRMEQIWTGYFNQTRLSNRWGLAGDVQLRTKDKFIHHLWQFVVRPSVIYYINDDIRLSAGYAYFRHYPADNHSMITQPEHRPWQQIQWQTKYRRNKTVQGVRFEQRFRRKIQNDSTLASGYNFNYRLRYSFLWQIPLSKQIEKGAWSFILSDEVHVNFGKQIAYNYFDQNRFFLGMAFYTNATDYLQFGYMNLFQQLPAGNRYRSTQIARISYFHNLDLRKKKF
jgi:hypothetical protein